MVVMCSLLHLPFKMDYLIQGNEGSYDGKSDSKYMIPLSLQTKVVTKRL